MHGAGSFVSTIGRKVRRVEDNAEATTAKSVVAVFTIAGVAVINAIITRNVFAAAAIAASAVIITIYAIHAAVDAIVAIS